MNPDFKLNLMISNVMNIHRAQLENTYIRIPAVGRKHLSPRRNVLNISNGDTDVTLNIRRAYKKDVEILKALLEKGTISKETYRQTGFLTTDTWNTLLGNCTHDTELRINDNIEDVALSADPEFILRDPHNGRLIYAANILKFGEIFGSDGPCVKIRPAAVKSVGEFVLNCREALSRGLDAKPVKNLHWFSNAAVEGKDIRGYLVYYCSGGHICFDTPRYLHLNIKKDGYYFFKCMSRILDELVAVPMVRLDGLSSPIRRWMCSHTGFFHYEHGKFEWRTLSGTWLSSPELAEAVLGVSKVVVQEIYERFADRDNDVKWAISGKGEGNLVSEFCRMTHEEVVKILDRGDAKAVTDNLISDTVGTIRGFTVADRYSRNIDAWENFLSRPSTLTGIELKKAWDLAA